MVTIRKRSKENEFYYISIDRYWNNKNTNQDSYDVKVLSTPQGKMVFAVLCDGKEKDGKPYTNYDMKFLIKPSAEKAA